MSSNSNRSERLPAPVRRSHSPRDDVDDTIDENDSLSPKTANAPGAASHENADHHVRFLSDVERIPRSFTDPAPNTPTRRTPASQGLTINTSVSTHGTGQSPPPSTDTRTIVLDSALSPQSPQSAISPQSRNRNRGYSLRRTLFARNVESQSEDNGAITELAVDGYGQATSSTSEKAAVSEERVGDARFPFSPSREEETAISDYFTLDGSAKSSTPWTKFSHSPFVLNYNLRLRAVLGRVKKTILRIHDIPPSKDGRHITLDVNRGQDLIDERTGSHFIDNTIRSSRYTAWSFFPRQLMAQFSKLANFYFLIVSILQMIPGLSTTGTFTTFIPLVIFVSISMGKEGFDDWRRYRLDKEENNRYAWVLRPGRGMQQNRTPSHDSYSPTTSAGEAEDWAAVKWQEIKVGDVIKLERDQPVPADVVLLHTEGINNIAYIETMALDGETNLKSKQPCQAVAKICTTADDIIQQANSLHFTVEDPNLDLYKFDGNVTVNGDTFPLTNNEIIYRGSVLRNTSQVYAMVIYTGEECKIRMNANKNPRIKRPALQAKVNRVVIVIVCFVLLLATVCTIAYSFWRKEVELKSWYLQQASVSYGPIFTSFFIMFNTLIPISLYVSLEIVKVAQMFLLNDIDLYDEESDTPLEARTSTINEELGQVSYIFSDKTGTLTNNSMRFRKMSVAGTAWLHDIDLREDAAREGQRRVLIHKKRSLKGKKSARPRLSMESRPSSQFSKLPAKPVSSNLVTPITPTHSMHRRLTHQGGHTTELTKYILRRPNSAFARKVKLFLLSLALCHTCLPERDEFGQIEFQAASPDELALVKAAQELGYVVVDRQSDSITLRTFPSGIDDDHFDEVYEILDVIEFSSARKRMSVVVRMPDQRICLFCKGADTVLRNLLRQSGLAHEKAGEVERRSSQRKMSEASEVIRRNSGLNGAPSRRSLSRRGSGFSTNHSTLRRSIDFWLKDRETDGGTPTRESASEHYSPRPSAHLARQSSDGRAFFSEEDEDLVDETLVVDDSAVFSRCFQHLNDFATEGLRTLLYGYRFIDQDTYENWKRDYQEATTSVIDRQQKIEQVGQLIESQLELAGATAIEDKLQKGVPEAIDKLRRANIKLWMLTGDKRETAINIGRSCRLVKEYSTLVILDQETNQVHDPIMKLTTDIRSGKVAHAVLVVDGQTLSMIESDEALMARFFTLAILVDSVICCRASPKQKAFLVRSVRKQVQNSITLAIGDGANDIAMIQEAHVGIGIAGKEGLQASRIADYSIAQFRFLLKLLLVHGRWNYIRVCKYTVGTFWKESLFYLTQALYQRWNGYTGTSLYEPWGLSMFNTLFTSLPVIFLGIFTKDLAASTLLAVPELYTKGQRHAGFNVRVYLGWLFMAVCEAMVIYFAMFSLFGEYMMSPDNTIYPLGLITFTACVVVINIKLQCLEVYNKSWLNLLVMVISIGGWFLWNILLAAGYNDASGKYIYDVHGNFFHHIGRSGTFWLVVLFIIMTVILFEVAVNAARAVLFPTDVDIFQTLEQDPEIRRRFEDAAASELQLGWDFGKKRSSKEIVMEEAEVAAREQEVHDLLNQRRVTSKDFSSEPGMEDVELSDLNRRPKPETDEEANIGGVSGGNGMFRRSLDIHNLFSTGFGAVKRGSELQ